MSIMWRNQNEMKRTDYQKWRDGQDWTLWIALLILALSMLFGALEKNGFINILK